MADSITDVLLRAGLAPELAANRQRDHVPPWAIVAACVVATTSMAIAIAAAMTRGPWIDEFWTLFAIDPHLSYAQALRQRWLTDVHPPLFYFLSRIVADRLGGDLAVLRLQNLTGMAALVAFFIHSGVTWRGARRFLLVYAVLAFSSYFATGYFAEYRSYYIQFACGLVFCGCGYSLLHGNLLVTRRHQRITTALFGLSGLLLANLHFVTALATAVTFAGMLLLALSQQRPRLAWHICLLGALAGLPLLATLWFQAPYLLARAAGHFWIKTGLFGALLVLVGSIAKGIGLSAAACTFAALAMRRRMVAARDIVIGLGFLAMAAVVLALLLLVSVYTPIIVDRYLVLCSVLVICGLAILAQDAIFAVRAGYPLLLANAALFLAIAGGKLIGEPRWNATASLIAARVAACPATTVAAMPFPYPGALPNEARVFAYGYDYLAARYGFRVHRPRAAEPGRSGTCPTLLWMEHVPWYLAGAAGRDALVLDTMRHALPATDFAGATVLRTKTGTVVVLAPH